MSEPPLIRLRGISRTYPGPPPVAALRPVDLDVLVGEYLTVMGRSGSGKSTLLHLLGLLDRPTGGRYELAGTEVTTMSDAGRTALRAHRIGFVFQSFHLLPHRTVLDNVQLALLYNQTPRRERAPAAAAALDQVRLQHRASALPTQLSGGERQRVAIARALVARPNLVLCDEPTGNLDSVTAGTVLDVLDELHRAGLTIIVITHDAQVAARAQRTIRLQDGLVTAAVAAVP